MLWNLSVLDCLVINNLILLLIINKLSQIILLIILLLSLLCAHVAAIILSIDTVLVHLSDVITLGFSFELGIGLCS